MPRSTHVRLLALLVALALLAPVVLAATGTIIIRNPNGSSGRCVQANAEPGRAPTADTGCAATATGAAADTGDLDGDGAPDSAAGMGCSSAGACDGDASMKKGTVKFFNDAKGFRAGGDLDGDGASDADVSCAESATDGGRACGHTASLHSTAVPSGVPAKADLAHGGNCGEHARQPTPEGEVARCDSGAGAGVAMGMEDVQVVGAGASASFGHSQGGMTGPPAGLISDQAHSGGSAGIAIDHEGVQVASAGASASATGDGHHGGGGGGGAGGILLFAREGDGKGCAGVFQGGQATVLCT